MRFVELKTQDQLDIQTLHRSRDRLVGERTALINQLRAILLERGIVVPKGKRHLEQQLAALLDGKEEHTLSERMRRLIHGARAALSHVAGRGTPRGRWLTALLARAHQNVAVVAFANKLARICWAVLRRARHLPTRRRSRRREIGRSAHVTLIFRRCLRVVDRDGLTESRAAFWKPGSKNGARRRVFYEDRVCCAGSNFIL